MALVKEPLLSEDSKVRRVKIIYRTPEGCDQQVERPVQRLILLAPVDDTTVVPECSGSSANNSSSPE